MRGNVNQNERKATKLSKRWRQIKRNFYKLSEKDRLKILGVLGAAILVVILVIAVLISFGKGKNGSINSDVFSGSASFDPNADNEYDPNNLGLDPEEYKDTILSVTDDAGKTYLTDTLFIGDSNTEALYSYRLLTLQNTIGISSMGIQSATNNTCVYFSGYSDPTTIPKAVSMLKPRRVIINFGTNNADGSMSEETFVKQYKTLISAIEKQYPYCDIIVMAIHPVAKNRSYKNITMQTIDSYNIALAEMCKEDGYKFLNTSEVLKDKNGFLKTSFVREDGIHLNEAGCNAVLEYARTHSYITKDERPNTSNIPQRRPAPYVPPASSEEMSSSSIISSSVASSSFISSSESESSSSIPDVPSSSEASVVVPEPSSETPSTPVEESSAPIGEESNSGSGSGSSSEAGG